MGCLTPYAKVLARISITKNHREEHLNKMFDVVTSCLYYLPKPSASADNTDLGFDNS